MAPRNLEQTLHRIEARAEDELSFLADTGAEYFSTAQLIKLKGQWQVKRQLFLQLNFVLIRTVAFSPITLMLWMACSYLGMGMLGWFFLILFPFAFLLFFAGQIFIRYAFQGNGHHEDIGQMIDCELENRRKNRKNAS